MIAPLARLRRLAAALRDCTSGLALTEFAFSLPVLLTLGLGGLETSNFVMAHLRVSNIAMTAADNAARVRDSIDEADVVELMTGAKMTGDSIEFAQNGRIILTSLENDGGKQWIRWQRCDGALNRSPTARPLTDDGATIVDGTEVLASDRSSVSPDPSSSAASTLTGLGEGNITSATGTAVIVAEVVYVYQPLIPNSFLDGREIRYESAFNVRQRTNQSIRNLGRITPRSCNRFSA